MTKIGVLTIRRIGSEKIGDGLWVGVLRCGCSFLTSDPIDKPPTEVQCGLHRHGLPATTSKPKKGK